MSRERIVTGTSRITVNIFVDPIVVEKFEKKLATLGISQREYFRQMVIKDLGLKFVPARYEDVENGQ